MIKMKNLLSESINEEEEQALVKFCKSMVGAEYFSADRIKEDAMELFFKLGSFRKAHKIPNRH